MWNYNLEKHQNTKVTNWNKKINNIVNVYIENYNAKRKLSNGRSNFTTKEFRINNFI